MVNLGLLVLAGLAAVVVLFRQQIGETGGALGQLGTGIQTGISALLSPRIRPELVPTLGFQTQLPGSCGPGENGELKAPWVSCRPGGVSPNPFLCCYPRATATPTSGFGVLAPGARTPPEIRYNGRVTNGANGKPYPSFNWDIENPPYYGETARISGRLN